MAERRSRREERRQETRRELIDAAIRVFVQRGFHDASLEQVARDAGYSTGAIYWHFGGGKDELFLAAFEAFAIRRVQELDEVRETLGAGPLPERLRRFADHWMARQAADPTFLVITLEFLAHSWRTPHLREAFATRAAAVRLAAARIIEQDARDAGLDLPMSAQDIGTALRELGVGLALAKLTDPDAFSDELFGDFVELFFQLATREGSRRSPEVRKED
jgi:AcrR family transcriptional regulator